MRFTKPFWPGIADGSVSVAFRRWKTPTVVAGRPYRTGGGRVDVLSVDIIDPESITDADAKLSGHALAQEVRAFLRQAEPVESTRHAYRVEFRLLAEEDPREVLGNDDDLSSDDIATIDARLARLDKASRTGPWTRRTLQLIADRPATRAPDLAASIGRETQPFKLDVRKLKNLGLTISLNPGYRLSPRGIAYMAIEAPEAR